MGTDGARAANAGDRRFPLLDWKRDSPSPFFKEA